jgi:enoyl-CoA hydratase/carnithine racemase
VPLARLEETTLEIVRTFAQGPTLTYGYTKSAVVHGWEAPSVEAAYEYQGQALHHAQQTEDFNEGRHAFLEKRPPRFRGR